jgi:hypothetical protein
MMFPAERYLRLSRIRESVLLPLGEAAAPDEGSSPHDFVDLQNRGAGSPHPALAAPPSPEGRGESPNNTPLIVPRPELVTED